MYHEMNTQLCCRCYLVHGTRHSTFSPLRVHFRTYAAFPKKEIQPDISTDTKDNTTTPINDTDTKTTTKTNLTNTNTITQKPYVRFTKNNYTNTNTTSNTQKSQVNTNANTHTRTTAGTQKPDTNFYANNRNTQNSHKNATTPLGYVPKYMSIPRGTTPAGYSPSSKSSPSSLPFPSPSSSTPPTSRGYAGSPQAFYTTPPPSATRRVHSSEISRPRAKFYPPPKRKPPLASKIYDSAALFEPWTVEFVQKTKTSITENSQPPAIAAHPEYTHTDYYDSATFLQTHQRKLSKLSKAMHMRFTRERSRWAKEEEEEEEETREEEEEDTEGEDEKENYWDRAAKRKASMQDKYKHDLLELMKRRMLHLDFEKPSNKGLIVGDNKKSMLYTDEELACMLQIKDPLWRALSDIRPPYKSHDNYLNFLAERLHNKATVESYNKMLHYTTLADRLQLAEHLFDDMLKSDISPNTETFNWMIKGYMQNCHVDKAITYFSQMLKHNATPDLTTYAFMIHGFMDNSLPAQAQSLFSPMKMQYELTDDLSFDALAKAFADDRELNFRVWLTQFLPVSSNQRAVLDKVEHIGSRGTKIEGKYYITHRSELNVIYSVDGKDSKSSPIKRLFYHHVSRNIRSKYLEILKSFLPVELEVDKDGIPLEKSIASLLSKVKERADSEKKKTKKKRGKEAEKEEKGKGEQTLNKKEEEKEKDEEEQEENEEKKEIQENRKKEKSAGDTGEQRPRDTEKGTEFVAYKKEEQVQKTEEKEKETKQQNEEEKYEKNASL